MIGEDHDDTEAFINQIPMPVYRGRLVPEASQANALKALNVFAFAGIGRPDKFFNTLEEAGAALTEKRSFADHYRYTADDIASIISEASAKLLIPVTTAKDAVKIAEVSSDALNTIRVVDVRLHIEDMDELISTVIKKNR